MEPGPEKREAMTRWIALNTFECALGKLTPDACRVNRARKTIGEWVRQESKEMDAHERAARKYFMPSVCETCQDWERLTAEVEARRTGMQGKSDGEAEAVPDAPAGRGDETEIAVSPTTREAPGEVAPLPGRVEAQGELKPEPAGAFEGGNDISADLPALEELQAAQPITEACDGAPAEEADPAGEAAYGTAVTIEEERIEAMEGEKTKSQTGGKQAKRPCRKCARVMTIKGRGLCGKCYEHAKAEAAAARAGEKTGKPSGTIGNEVEMAIMVDFSPMPYLLEAITQAAQAELRTIPAQLLWELNKCAANFKQGA